MFCPACRVTYPADYRVCPTDGTQLLAGDRIGKYKVDGLIGVGGMGAVYRAVNPDTQAHVAIKVMNAAVAGADEARARFQREAEASARLKTGHVVQVYDFGVAPDGNMYLVMELLVGHTLRDEVASLPDAMPLARVQLVLDGALRGLVAAHKAGIVHRDLKPENVFVATVDDGEVTKLLDFGIARVRSKTSDLQTRAGTMMGTAAYMAPEQAAGNVDAMGSWTDIYAMGAITYELLAGTPPFTGESLAEVLTKVMAGTHRPLAEMRPGLPIKMYELVERCLAVDPARRPRDADAMRAELLAARLVPPGTEVPPFGGAAARPPVHTPAPMSTNPNVETAMLQITRDKEAVASLLGYFETKRYGANVTLFEAGDASDAMYLVETGSLAILDGKRHIRDMGPGEVFGESGIYRDTKRSATVRTMAPCVLLRLSGEALEAMSRDSPKLVTELHKFVAAMLARRMTEQTAAPARRSSVPLVAIAGLVVVGGAVAVAVVMSGGGGGGGGAPAAGHTDTGAVIGAAPVDAAPQPPPPPPPKTPPPPPPPRAADPRDAMIHIPAGDHDVGESPAPAGALPRAHVHVDELWIDPAELTLGQVRAALHATVGGMPKDGPDVPARNLTYAQAEAACTALGKRVPSELEWEVAALTTPNDPKIALPAKLIALAPSKHAGDCSPAGLCDMLGGVAEWTSTDDPTAKGAKIVRGASYQVAPDAGWNATIHARTSLAQADDEVGVRCALSR